MLELPVEVEALVEVGGVDADPGADVPGVVVHPVLVVVDAEEPPAPGAVHEAQQLVLEARVALPH